MVLNEIKKQGSWNDVSDDLNNNFIKIGTEVDTLRLATTRFKGYYNSVEALITRYPNPTVGDNAWVGINYPGTVYKESNGNWTNTGITPNVNPLNMGDYAKSVDLSTEISNRKEADAEMLRQFNGTLNSRIDQTVHRSTLFSDRIQAGALGWETPITNDEKNEIYGILDRFYEGGITYIQSLNTDGFKSYYTLLNIHTDLTTYKILMFSFIIKDDVWFVSIDYTGRVPNGEWTVKKLSEVIDARTGILISVQKDAKNGLASLDSNAKLKASYMPGDLVVAMNSTPYISTIFNAPRFSEELAPNDTNITQGEYSELWRMEGYATEGRPIFIKRSFTDAQGQGVIAITPVTIARSGPIITLSIIQNDYFIQLIANTSSNTWEHSYISIRDFHMFILYVGVYLDEFEDRLKGISYNSVAYTDPFVNLGTIFPDYQGLQTVLDTLNGGSINKSGHYRIGVAGTIFDVFNTCTSLTNNTWHQTIRGTVRTDNSGLYLQQHHTVQELTRVCTNGVWGQWSKISGSSGNLILSYTTDSATTRKTIPTPDRKSGLMVSYNHPTNGWVNEQYIRTDTSEAEWIKDSNWRLNPQFIALTQQQYDALPASKLSDGNYYTII